MGDCTLREECVAVVHPEWLKAQQGTSLQSHTADPARFER